jgi:hypothetical protein
MELICSNCLKSFDKKDIYIATKYMTILNQNKGMYNTFFCYKCIKDIENVINSIPFEEIIKHSTKVPNQNLNEKTVINLTKEQMNMILNFHKNNDLLSAFFYFKELNLVKTTKIIEVEFNKLWESLF